MDTEELFRLALGLKAPWTVNQIRFSDTDQRLDIWLDFPAGGRFACPGGDGEYGVYDTAERTWRHLNFFQHQTYLHARQPRIDCPQHGVKTVEVPWARPGVGFTLLMEAFIVALVQHGMTPAQVARLIGEYDTRIWRVLDHYVQEARAKADHSAVEAVGVDETSRRRGHRYISVFMDLDQKRVLFSTEGRDAQTIQAFRQDLEAHGGSADRVREACLDMSPAYINGLTEHFPQAQMTFDPFHVAKVVNDAVDEVRRQEQKDRPELKGTRYLWLKNEWNHTTAQAQRFQALRNRDLKTARAHHLKSVLQDIMAEKDPAVGEDLLGAWYYWATHSRLAPMIEAARTIKRHWKGVIHWFRSRISNGLLEAINGLIQSAKRKARGFRSTRYLIMMIYLIAGKLDLDLPELNYATHTK
jgi:transposase